MRQYMKVTLTVNEVVGVQCNRCGKCIAVRNGAPGEEIVAIRHRYGYPSAQDGTVCEFDLCESCFESWLGMLRIPATRTENESGNG